MDSKRDFFVAHLDFDFVYGDFFYGLYHGKITIKPRFGRIFLEHLELFPSNKQANPRNNGREFSWDVFFFLRVWDGFFARKGFSDEKLFGGFWRTFQECFFGVNLAMILFNLGGGFNFFNFHPDPRGNDPIWLAHIFQTGWFNQQLAIYFMGYSDLSMNNQGAFLRNRWCERKGGSCGLGYLHQILNRSHPPKFNSPPLKSYQNPVGKDHKGSSSSPSCFQWFDSVFPRVLLDLKRHQWLEIPWFLGYANFYVMIGRWR